MNIILILMILATFSQLPAVFGDALTSSRKVCQKKNILLINEEKLIIFDFSSEPSHFRKILHSECTSWAHSRNLLARSKAKRSFAKVAKVVKDVFKKARPTIMKGGICIFKGSVAVGKTVVKTAASEIAKESVGAIAEWTAKKFAEAKYEKEKKEEEEEAKDNTGLYLFNGGPKDEEENENDEYLSESLHELLRSAIGEILYNADFTKLTYLKAAFSEQLTSVLEQLEHDLKDIPYYYIDPSSLKCNDRKASISFKITTFSAGPDGSPLPAKNCEDIGYINEETDQYFYRVLPQISYFNQSGTFSVHPELCAGYEDVLICEPNAFEASACSPQDTSKCDLRVLEQSSEIYRKLKVGVVVSGSFELVQVWENDVVTLVYRVEPFKPHYISAGKDQHIKFGSHQLTDNTERKHGIIKKIV